jgi:hypothetical protein
MAHYRLYFYHEGQRPGPGRRIAHALDLECEDDAEAIREVEKHRETPNTYMELWQRDRLVKTFPA